MKSEASEMSSKHILEVLGTTFLWFAFPDLCVSSVSQFQESGCFQHLAAQVLHMVSESK